MAILGDSMARQSFVTLISLLQGSSDVVDFTTHKRILWRRHQLRPGVTADELHLPGSWRHEDPALASALAGQSVSPIHIRHLPVVHAIDYYNVPCYTASDAKAAANFIETGLYDVVVLHEPAYWHVTSFCGEPKETGDMDRFNRFQWGGDLRELANEDFVRVKTFWARMRQAATARGRVGATYMVVSAPAENVPQENIEPLQALSRAVSLLFTASDGNGSAVWHHIDWAELTSRTRPEHLANNWHYACYTSIEAYRYAPRSPILIKTRSNGTCFEHGNTALWQTLIAPRLVLRER